MAEYRKCKICGSSNLVMLRGIRWGNKYKSLSKCQMCDFTFDIEDNVMRAAYGNEFFDPYVTNEVIRSLRRAEAHWMADQYQLTGMNYMEIGPGVGHFMEGLKEKVPDIRLNAVELAPLVAEACRKMGANVIESDWENLPYNALLSHCGACDFVASIHVIEHMEEPLLALRKMRWLLKPSGILYIHTPNHDHARNENWRLYALEHVSLFGECSLRVAFEMVGVTVAGVRKLYDDDLIVFGMKAG